MSIAQKIIASRKPFTLFHTWTVSETLLQCAIDEHKSMDLDVCIDDGGNPYLGHSREYHEKSGEPYFKSLPIWDVVDRIANSDIVALIDCKHNGAWPVIENVIDKIGPERCIVDSYVSEFKFGHGRGESEPDFITEWSPIAKLLELKTNFPWATTTACVKWPPPEMLCSAAYRKLVDYILELSKENRIDAVCLSVPDGTITDQWLRFFLAENIIVRVGIDRIDPTTLSEPYIGETDRLELASRSIFRD
jgi:hypothetical protein